MPRRWLASSSQVQRGGYTVDYYPGEQVTVAVFTIEYVLRIIVADRRLSFIFSFFGLVDLVAILPFYVAPGVDLGQHAHDVRPGEETHHLVVPDHRGAPDTGRHELLRGLGLVPPAALEGLDHQRALELLEIDAGGRQADLR